MVTLILACKGGKKNSLALNIDDLYILRTVTNLLSIFSMAPLSTKRRKLDNGRSISPSESESSQIEQTPNHDSQVKTQPQTPTQPRPKRTADDDEAAIYAGGLYKTNLFKLQVDELLAEVQPNYEKRLKGVDDLLRKLKGLIESIGDRDAVSVSISPDVPEFLLSLTIN